MFHVNEEASNMYLTPFISKVEWLQNTIFLVYVLFRISQILVAFFLIGFNFFRADLSLQ